MEGVPLQGFLVVSGLLFLLGLFAVMTRRNVIWLLMGVELILNSASLNFVAFSRYVEPVDGAPEHAGMAASVVIILLAAAEAAVALAILVAIYRNFKTISSDDLQELRG